VGRVTAASPVVLGRPLVLRRGELLLVTFGAAQPPFGQAHPHGAAVGVVEKSSHGFALGGVSAKFFGWTHS
jgi:hypothetical protein